jgi:hypothetical protein
MFDMARLDPYHGARRSIIAEDTARERDIAAHPPRPSGGPFPIRRCAARYPGSVTLRGRAIRCESATGHDGMHGHSFAARYWD